MNVVASQIIRGLLYRNVSSKLPKNLFCTKPDIQEAIGNMVKSSKVVVFMKGVPEQPRCGFSNAVVQILKLHGVKYNAHDVLESDDLRDGIKQYSSWPTIPQVFINGEFVGGCDILMQLHESGEILKELQKVGIESAMKNEYPRRK